MSGARRAPAGGHKRQRGLTLIELMVALVLSMVLMTGMISVFTANKRTFQLQDALARLQENGRFAVHLMTRDIRNAGYWGCGSLTPRVTNTLSQASSYPFSYSNAVDGFEAGASSWSPALDNSIVNALAGSDVFTVRPSEGGGGRVVQHNSSTAPLSVVAHAGLAIGQIAMVSDCEDAAIFQITDVNVSGGSTNIVHGVSLGKKFTNGEVVGLATRTYYVRSGASGVPSLWRIEDGTAQEIVEGVEQLQILYGVDTDNDQAANQYVAANSITDWGQVVSVRLNLLLQSVRDNVLESSQQPFTFNGATFTPTDNRLRQTFTATIAIRNRLG
jgi:type IV pilus assembly protein PilW